MRILRIFLLAASLTALSGCANTDKPERSDRKVSETPQYKIVEKADISTRDQRRFRLRIVLPSHYPEAAVRSTAREIVKEIDEPRSEITIFFYGPDSDPQSVYDIARVIWTDAGLTDVDYKQPISIKQSGLTRSDGVGMLGVPLPKNAKLIENRPGDSSKGIDPRQRYSIEADSESILGFFESEMIKEGWARDGLSERTTLFFSKNGTMIGIIVNKNGRSFILMGS